MRLSPLTLPIKSLGPICNACGPVDFVGPVTWLGSP